MTEEEITRNILGFIPTFYKKLESSNTYQLVYSISFSFQTFQENSAGLKESIQISTAVGTELDDIGELFLLTRITGESDEDYRARILGFWQGSIKGGTAEGLISLLQSILNISDASRITIDESEPMVLNFTIEIEDTDIPSDSINTSLEESKAAGIYINDITYTSYNDIFLVNFSGYNGKDKIL